MVRGRCHVARMAVSGARMAPSVDSARAPISLRVYGRRRTTPRFLAWIPIPAARHSVSPTGRGAARRRPPATAQRSRDAAA